MAFTLTAQQFASLFSSLVSRASIMRWNKQAGRSRLHSLVEDIERYVRYGELPFEYSQAAYGLNWAIVTGRVNPQTANAIEAMNTRQMCLLVHELAAYDYNISLYPAYLMQKYTPAAA